MYLNQNSFLTGCGGSYLSSQHSGAWSSGVIAEPGLRSMTLSQERHEEQLSLSSQGEYEPRGSYSHLYSLVLPYILQNHVLEPDGKIARSQFPPSFLYCHTHTQDQNISFGGQCSLPMAMSPCRFWLTRVHCSLRVVWRRWIHYLFSLSYVWGLVCSDVHILYFYI